MRGLLNLKTTLALLGGFIFLIGGNVLSAQDKNAEGRYHHEKAYSDLHKISFKIKESIEDIISGVPVEIEGEYVFSKTVLPEFYENRDFMPAWDDYDVLMDVIGSLEKSYEDGLNPADYHADVLQKIVARIELKLGEDDFDYDWVAEFDMMVTDALLLYAYHLIEGKVDPVNLDPNWNYSFREVLPEAPYNLERAIESGEISIALDQIRPEMPGYRLLMEHLAHYRVVDENGGWGRISQGGAIKPGESDSRIPDIRQRFLMSGYLSTDTNLQSVLYDEKLEKDVINFQKLHALSTDGVIGKGTIEALNVSVEDRIGMLRVNMERIRWIAGNLSEHYIVVNIAAFKAYYIIGDEFIFTTNVQVGKTYHKTPVFKERLRYVEFNPTWTVPVSITRNEMIPKMKKDPSYLDSRNFEILDGAGNIVPNSSIDYENLSVDNFPYTIRQKPGPGNALGEVKFIFPNKFSVYLHDTPSKSLFGREERTFSHGCIRTQNPLDLAEVILDGSEWDREKIYKTIQSRKTMRVFPDNKIDVLLLYWTAGYYDGEGVGFFKDVYGRDQKVLKQLNSKDKRSPKSEKL